MSAKKVSCFRIGARNARRSAIDGNGIDYARYERQLGLPGMGKAGQEKLASSRVLVVGAGGLGSPILWYLAAAGVGTLGIADGDVVAVSNLNRQILHGAADIGRPKTDSAREKLKAFNPEIDLIPYQQTLTPDNAGDIMAGYDLVMAAVDSRKSRYIINQVCYDRGIPWVDGGVDRFSGMVSVYAPPAGPCYRCLTGGAPGGGGTPRLFGALAGTVGLLQVQEAIKLILGIGKPLTGRVLFYDALEPRFETVEIAADPDCPVCGRTRVQGR